MDGGGISNLPRSTLVAAGLLLVGGVLGAFALGLPWAHLEGSIDFGGGFFGGSNIEFEGDYGAFGVTFEGEDASYDDSDLDDADGVGKMRAGGPLLTIGMSLGFVGLVLVGLDLLVPERYLDWGALGASALAVTLSGLGLGLLASGIHDHVTGQFGGTATATWSAGFWLAVASAALLLGATAVLVVAAARRAMAGADDGEHAEADAPDLAPSGA